MRRLRRIDLAAFFVLTAGIALAFGVARGVANGEGAILFGLVLAIALPIGLATAWFTRFFIEDLAFHFGKSRRRIEDADLSRFDPSDKNKAES